MNTLNIFPLFPNIGIGWLWLITIVGCWLSIASTSLYWHRSLTHGAVKYVQPLVWLFRFQLFLTTGVSEKLWKVFHWDHHKAPDSPNDAHSPRNPLVFKLFGKERKIVGPLAPGLRYFVLYARKWNKGNKKYLILGPIIFLCILCLLFGIHGLWMCGIIVFYMPIMAGLGINGFGHSGKTKNSKGNYAINIGFNKIGILILDIATCSESRHGSHHDHDGSARFSEKPRSGDIGWYIIVTLKHLGLASKVKYYSAKNPGKLIML